MIKINRNKIIEKRNSLIHAYLVSIPFLNYVFGELFGGSAMILNIVILCILALRNYKAFKNYKFNSFFLLYITFVCIYYIFTLILGNSDLTILEFCFYFLLATILSLNIGNTEKTIRYVTISSILVLPFYEKIFELNAINIYTNTIVSMNLSYTILPMIIAGLLHFIYYRKSAGIIVKLCYLLDFLFAIQLALKSNRGILVAYAVTAIFLYLKHNSKTKINKIFIVKLLTILMIFLIIIYNMDTILVFINNFLAKFNISANFIEKSLRLMSTGTNDLSNGRSEIYKFTIKGIIESPLFGHGISRIYYLSNSVINYPHNFLLQILYDGGLLLFIPFMYLIFIAIRTALKKMNDNSDIIIMFFILITIPKMFFSSNLWTNASFFFLMGYTAKYLIKIRKRVE